MYLEPISADNVFSTASRDYIISATLKMMISLTKSGSCVVMHKSFNNVFDTEICTTSLASLSIS